ncbi:MAG TPA: phage holin family protein [Solirubrobacteraceae bacterium]|nr:phage holin family protein [Solirubrobacteraceae bacterium]
MTTHDMRTEEELRERPIGDLVKQLASQTSTLVRQELDLAKAEMSQKAATAGKGAGLIGGAAVTGLLAAGALTACLILVLSEAMDAWLAALIVAVVMGAVAAVLGLAGRNKVREATPPVPEQTVETVKEDVEWAKTRTPSART